MTILDRILDLLAPPATRRLLDAFEGLPPTPRAPDPVTTAALLAAKVTGDMAEDAAARSRGKARAEDAGPMKVAGAKVGDARYAGAVIKGGRPYVRPVRRGVV